MDQSKITMPVISQNSSEESGSGSYSQDGRQIRVGVTYQNLQNRFIVNIQSALRQRADELNVELIEADGKGRAENQIYQVENFIARKLDVIILNPYSFEDCRAAVESANRAGIPILTVNNLVSNQDKCATFVGSDAVESGRIQMEAAAKKLNGTGNIVIFHGPIGHDAEIGRRKGVQEILDQYPDIEVIYEQSANWSREEGEAIMEIWLQSGERIDAVLAQNDEMALGALNAIKAAGNAGGILIYGMDGISDALEAISSGDLTGTVFQDAQGQGSGAIEAAIKIAKGQKVIKSIYIPYVFIDKANLSEYFTESDTSR
ncbi:MAG: substrate-binding domain-containing protein [Saccharofermentanales bacterium]